VVAEEAEEVVAEAVEAGVAVAVAVEAVGPHSPR
jgi:hypothetical protein